ncbi:RHS repeat domain-containing protein [Phocaeicola plebeius]|uniref:RHS repeat domain-containing protein n=1 Tax=Phocaeicola plebeius TaxID=310297 RepID=UPI0026EDD258|nr:RHS repeat-associated core domain-containing protein [Phocaeicola plebeius]
MPNQAIATYVTQWTYDSHNRLLEMIYPDEEKVTYSYNLGGQLEKVRGEKSYGYDYITKLGYDKFEQRSYLKYCNGAETFYTYDNRRRLSNLAVNSVNTAIMDNDYTFDAVSNVLSVANNASLPASGNAGGKMSHAYTYDGLYRLVSATGTYTGADSKSASYTLAMGYDNMHRITSKSQHLTQDNVQFSGTLNVGYDLAYTYGTEAGKKFQLASVKDVNYRTEETPGDNKIENNHVYLYDKNGNLIYVNTRRMMKDGHNETGTGERKLIWDEENRLLAVDDNGFVSNYWYDADGERTVKTSGESDQVYVNGVFSGGSTNTAKFSLYVSPYLVANQGGRYTKHIYAGSQRIVSKVGDFASYGSDPRRIEYAGANTDGLSVDYKAKYAAQQQVIKDNYKFFDVPYNGEDNNDYVDGQGFCCNDGSMEAAMARTKAQARAVARSFKDPDNYENLQFFYHPDHLGSSSFITNLEGEVVQHIEYVPFGEVFIEERNSVWNTPYLFNAKEFDEETGMYYYGARYYEPRLCLWMACDSETELYPNISGYAYCLNNPVKLKDPDGNHVEVTLNEENKYIVTGGVLNNDKNIYIMKDGKRTGEILGKSLTKYSFFGSNNKVVVGAPIDMSDKSGQNFFDKDIVESKIDVIYYMANATGGQKYDFKTVGIKDRGNMSKTQYSYRGMPFTDENGNKFIASARDIGNYSAGYMAGISGQGWEASRAAFDALESVQMRKFSTEAMVSQAAEKAGFDRGHKKYWQQQYEVQRILQEGRVNTWNAIKGWFGSLFGK